MKTKHLLTALALPAVFAACTAEDIVTESVSQAQRVALNENFKLNFGGVESRLSAGEVGEALIFDFEEGDMVGGAIIDSYDPAGATLDAKYPTVDYVSANQPFTYDGSNWTINHTMVEGKYLFYYPYNEANNSRGAAQFSIPVMQDLSDKTTGKFNPKAAVERYGVAVGYQFLTKEDLSASVELAPIFSYARIVLKLDNSYAGGEVEKIVLAAPTTNPFKLNGQFGNKKVQKLFDAEATGIDADATDDKFDWKNYDETANFALENSATASPNYYVADLNETSSVMVGKVPAGTKMVADAQNNNTFETYMVMPAQEFTAGEKLTVYLYMADGRVYQGDTADALDFNRNTPKKVEVTLTAASTAQYIVASQEDWNENVSKMGKGSATFIIADPDFTITNDMKYPDAETAIITVNEVKVSGNNVTMKNVNAGTIIVEEGAKLTTDVTTKVTTKIVNEGEVVVAKNPESRAIIAYEIAAIENAATLTVNEGAEIATALTNKKGATVENAGVITISGTNNGTINNAGTIYVNASGFLNDEVEYEVDKDGEEVIINTPAIVNKATGKFRADGEFTNKAKFENNGILSCKNNAGTIVNSLTSDNGVGFKADGIIDAKSGSTTYITTNEAKVIVYAMKQANVTVNENKKTIEYTATNAAETLDGSAVTDIVATKDLEIKHVDDEETYSFENLIVKNNAKVKLTAPEGKSISLTTMDVYANATIASDFTVETLNVNKGAVVNVPEELTMDVETIKNEGTVSVVGTLKLTAYAEGSTLVGDIEDNGKGTIVWDATDEQKTEAANKAAYETAMLDALKVYATQASTFENNFNYNLNDTVTTVKLGADNKIYYGADEAFEYWVGITSSETGKAATDAYETYKESIVSADAKAKSVFLDSYSTVVAAYITELKAKTDYTAFAALEDFKISVPQNSLYVNIFGETKRGDVRRTDAKKNVTVSAKENALTRFKYYLLNGTTNDKLTEEVKMVLCSETSYDNVSAYVPDYTFAFETSNVFLVYKNLIAKYAGQFGASNLSTQPDILGDADKGIIGWVKRAANIKDTDENVTVADKIARDYVNATDYAIYNESLNWDYTNATIKAIKNLTLDNKTFEEVNE